MPSNDYKNKTKELISKAREKKLIRTYAEICETESGNKTILSEEEVNYYSFLENQKKKPYKIGDIVFVSRYMYKNGTNGKNHSFVIIDEQIAVDINYFGFLLSSQLEKTRYPYNQRLDKNTMNNLYQDSIVKCDNLIVISEIEIKFKIGKVAEEDLERFVDTYKRYLNNN